MYICSSDTRLLCSCRECTRGADPIPITSRREQHYIVTYKISATRVRLAPNLKAQDLLMLLKLY